MNIVLDNQMNDRQTPNAPTDNEPSKPAIIEQPRLGIIHLMLWTAGTAVALTIDRVAQDLVPEESSLVDPIQPGISAVWAICVGPAIGAWAILVRRRLHGIRFPTEPGEWLLLVSGASYVFSQLCTTVGQLTQDADATQAPLPLLWFAMGHLFPAIGYVIAALYNRRPRSWMVCFATIAIVHALLVIELLAHSFSVYWPYLNLISFAFVCLPLVVLVASGIDLGRRRHFGWLHWVGVITYLCGMLMWVSVVVWLMLTL